LDKKEKKEILEELETKDTITRNGMTYFLSYGVLYVLPCVEFKARSLFYENENIPFSYYKHYLTFCSQTKNVEELEALSKIKIEKVYQSNAVTCWKITDYPPSLDYQDIDVKRLESARGETLEDLKRPQERDSWITDYARKIRDYLRRVMQ
jgi:hypothetical protein